jgi:hypothetical protein
MLIPGGPALAKGVTLSIIDSETWSGKPEPGTGFYKHGFFIWLPLKTSRLDTINGIRSQGSIQKGAGMQVQRTTKLGVKLHIILLAGEWR